MSWQIYLLINLGAGAVREFYYKKIADRVDPLVTNFYFSLFMGLMLLFAHFVKYGFWPEINFRFAATGLLFIIAFVSYLSAVKFSLTQSILFQSYSILVTIILTALFLGEGKYLDISKTIGQKAVGGGLLALVSIWFLLHPDKRREEKLEKKWFFYILMTILFFGIGAFLTLFFIQESNSLTVLTNQTLLMSPVLFLINILTRRKVILDSHLTKMILFATIAATIAVVFFYQALEYVPATNLLPLQQVSLVIITMFTGIIFFKEVRFFSGKRLLGMILGLMGILLLVTS
ncbi:hypothetical protein A3D78_03585 [Candidatus Gottesmanbacteria bacterium RIFCSPHIGHO2_02_FULL_39_14]|uniref:EamA domain-containing protein n=2 Tax=Candidatus Gottesmaniibacteriota TaxID=1752720 RepID=A0A1F5ZZQ7_9BACT|nr:MAG: hypothetical protein A3D78_03585 [Candidatus Gottesmanbacteria bacterium RIFCSPHIGHO2_02_FULL_39_14]OGG31856.1 MAG: hypothetical protein A3I51_04485 [Candidatus Gottesmanbacteria bacterium RIFCSPLOWO2_02_FULL_38_8]